MMSNAAKKVAGAVGAIGTVVATSASIGGSASSITATLAGIGGIVGGGMATGVVAVAAAPLFVGGICYGLASWLKNK